MVKEPRKQHPTDLTDSADKNSKEAWEMYFQEGWEKNNGREQTRLFAHYFLETVRLPDGTQSLLDVGCALGDSMPEFRKRYSNLRLTGCDVSAEAIKKARSHYGAIATFEQWTFEQIQGSFDVIFCSNALEHFVNYLEIARVLLAHCKWLYIMVPYQELRGGRPLTPVPGEWHVATFGKTSFEDLVRSGAADRINTWVVYTPGAWGPISWFAKLKHLLRWGKLPQDYRQLIVEVQSAEAR